MDTEPSFDAADLADAILGPDTVAGQPTEPITQETPVIPAFAVPPPATRGGVWSEAQRALFALAVIAIVVVLIGVAAMNASTEAERPCEQPPGLFDVACESQ